MSARGRFLVPLALGASPLPAQSAAPAQHAAESITAAGIARHIEVLSSDSMLRRTTPSPELERTAAYVASEFKKLGLQPFGERTRTRDNTDDTAWFSGYPIPGNLKLDYGRTRLSLRLERDGEPRGLQEGQRGIQRQVTLGFSGAARFAADTIPESGARNHYESYTKPSAFLLSGPHTTESVRQAELRDQLVIYVPPPGGDSAAQQAIVDQLRASNHVVVLPNEDETTFARRRDAAARHAPVVIDQYMERSLGVTRWAAFVQSDSVAGLLRAAGIELDDVRGTATAGVREIPSMRATLQVQLDTARQDAAAALNVVALLPGVGPKFTMPQQWGTTEVDEYVLVTAHMDRDGAEGDNTAGVAALLELARAFSQPGARPRRSIIFLVTSGSEPNLVGSTYWVGRSGRRELPKIAINLDNIGRNSSGAVAINGLRDFDFPKRIDWVVAEHPELRLEVIDGGSIVTFGSDHIAFVRKALPALYVHDPIVGDTPASASTAIDVEQLARVARLVFYIAHELGTNASGPIWNAEGRRNRGPLLEP